MLRHQVLHLRCQRRRQHALTADQHRTLRAQRFDTRRKSVAHRIRTRQQHRRIQRAGQRRSRQRIRERLARRNHHPIRLFETGSCNRIGRLISSRTRQTRQPATLRLRDRSLPRLRGRTVPPVQLNRRTGRDIAAGHIDRTTRLRVHQTDIAVPRVTQRPTLRQRTIRRPLLDPRAIRHGTGRDLHQLAGIHAANLDQPVAHTTEAEQLGIRIRPILHLKLRAIIIRAIGNAERHRALPGRGQTRRTFRHDGRSVGNHEPLRLRIIRSIQLHLCAVRRIAAGQIQHPIAQHGLDVHAALVRHTKPPALRGRVVARPLLNRGTHDGVAALHIQRKPRRHVHDLVRAVALRNELELHRILRTRLQTSHRARG